MHYRGKDGAGVRLGKLAAVVVGVAAACLAESQYTENAIIFMFKAAEFKNASTYYTTNGSTRLTTSTHLLDLRFSYGLPGGGGGGGQQQGLLEKLTSQGGGGGGTGNQDYDVVTCALGVVYVGDGGEYPLNRLGMTATSSGQLPQACMVPYANGGQSPDSTKPGLMVGLSPGDQVGIDVLCDAANDPTQTLPPGFVSVVATVHDVHYHWTGTGWTTTTKTTYQRVKYEIQKHFTQNVASIDARACYGNPNLDGELPGDPNAPLRNPSFPGWLFKGGLFVGNMPWVSGDQSSTSRTQFDFGPSTADSQLRVSGLSCFYMGTPASANGAVTVGAYMPATGGQPLYTWSNKWPVTPRATPGNPPDYSQDPLDSVAFTSTSAQDYCNWSLTQLTSNSGVITGNCEGLYPYFVLCVADEPDFVSGNNTAWRYLASPAYAATFPTTLYIADSAPRIWNVLARLEWDWSHNY